MRPMPVARWVGARQNRRIALLPLFPWDKLKKPFGKRVLRSSTARRNYLRKRGLRWCVRKRGVTVTSV